MIDDSKLVANATEVITEYGVDLSKAEVEVEHSEDGYTSGVIWTQPNGARIFLSAIWWNKDTGEILQCGTNYGQLTL